jgi:hypothetical protein
MLDLLILIDELRRKREAEEAAKAQTPSGEDVIRAQIEAYDLWMAPVGRRPN